MDISTSDHLGQEITDALLDEPALLVIDLCKFDYRLAAFDRNYGDLLQGPNADCADTRGPAGARGLSRENIELIAHRNAQLNDTR